MSNQASLFDQARPDNTLAAFVSREAVRMWPSAEHRKRSLAQVHKFAVCGDNKSRPISQFLPRDVHTFIDKLVADGASEATANRYLAAISKVFNHAVDEQIINSVPKLKFFKVKSQRVRYFSDLEIDQITSFFSNNGDWWMADMFTLALKTGMRKSEIIAIGEGKADISDCGKWVYLPPEVTKTNKQRNVAILHPAANAAARRIQAGLAAHYTRRKFDYRWSLVKREYARTDDTFVFHVTRHNAASRMANELMVPTVTIAQALGHANLATTERYCHVKPDTLLDISTQM